MALSRTFAATLSVLTLAVFAACSPSASNKATEEEGGETPGEGEGEGGGEGEGDCVCDGIKVDEGKVNAACGESVCVEGHGYRCADDGQSVESDPDVCPPNWSGGKGGKTGLREAKLADGGEDRTYAIHVPDSYSDDKGMPMMVHFHGWRPAPAGVKDEIEYVWQETGEKKGFTTVAPEGVPCPSLNPKGEPFLCFPNESDDAWVEKLIETVTKQYNVDLDHVYLSGHSGGTYYVEWFALANPDKFHAAVTFSGGCVTDGDNYINSCSQYEELIEKADRKVPWYIVHNPGDKVVPPSWSRNMSKVFEEADYPLKTHFKAYEAGSSGHSIDPALIPDIWDWLTKSDSKFRAKW